VWSTPASSRRESTRANERALGQTPEECVQIDPFGESGGWLDGRTPYKLIAIRNPIPLDQPSQLMQIASFHPLFGDLIW
jgi:hypothetical protein